MTQSDLGPQREGEKPSPLMHRCEKSDPAKVMEPEPGTVSAPAPATGKPQIRTGDRFVTALAAAAAIASAVAAWFSVDAANRQEQATYQSQLYNKQVDAIGAMMRSAENDAQQIDQIYEHFLATRPSGQDIDPQVVSNTQRREEDIFNRFWINFLITWLVVPDEVKEKLNVILDTMFYFRAKVTAAETPGNADLTEEERQDMVNQVLVRARTLGDCASHQFSTSGRPLDGGQFKTCFKASD